MSVEKTVIGHYEREGLAERILAQARAGAADPAHLTAADFSFYDEMHIGGSKATAHLMEALGLAAGMKVLDIGSGVGGPARYIAENYDVRVTGIDLTPGYKEVAGALSVATRLADRTEFITGNALALPFADASFDAAYTIHVAMNIQDKAGLYREAARVLRPGAAFGIYDVMAGQDGAALEFPVPWADTQGSSFLVTPRAAEDLLRAAGFEVMTSESRRDFGLAALEKLQNHESLRTREGDFPLRVRTLIANIRQGLCAPWQIICRRT